MSTFYLTTPIYYVNDLPHIGHIYTSTVADALARYRRMRGDRVRFLTGTDEHGQKILRAAEEQGTTPRALADRVVGRYHELKAELGFSYDDFIRTSEARHRLGVEAIIERIQANGDLYVDRHGGWYCTSCETFYTEKELLPGNRCPDHGREVEWTEEENVFFRLSKYQQPLLDLLDENPEWVRPATRRNEVRAFIESGLRDLSVSRAGLPWGIPFPGHEGQTVYVWLDALTNYLSALGFGSDDDSLYQELWAAADGPKVHLIGKDILRHHCVFWPAFLLSAGLPLPSTVWVHGWWMRDDRKVSKSVGNVVRPDELIREFGPDPFRYFLLREMHFGQDASYSDEAFVDRFNADLANDLGNTYSRLATLSRKAFEGRTPPTPCDSNPLIEASNHAVSRYHEAMEELSFDRALMALWALLSETNQYLVSREPWKLIRKGERADESVSRILWNGLEALRIVTTALLPFMPEVAARLLRAIAVDPDGATVADLSWGGLPTDADLPKPEPLFPRIDKEAWLAAAVAEDGDDDQEKTDMISIEQFFETQLRVATVEAAEPIPKSSKLLQLRVTLAEGETRAVVAGIAKAYSPEELVGRQVVIVANLQPAKLMGVESQGMVLAASVDGRPVLLRPDEVVPQGTEVR